jgi:hypothetical protein
VILALAIAGTLAAQSDPVTFRRGAWSGQCFRQGYLAGRDHELCQAEIFVETGARVERSAEGLSVKPYEGDGCQGDGPEPGFLPSAAFARRDRASVVARFVRSQIEAALKTCNLQRPIPHIRESDMVAFLRKSDGLRPGSFLLDSTRRPPMAQKCAAQFERDWREGLRTHPVPTGSQVNLMMYTFSKGGPERAEKRFAALPALLDDYVAIATGPGGVMIGGRKSADAWRNPPTDWFVTLCDVGIDAWSGFIELAVYPGKEGQTPIFGVRVPTGVALGEGFLITQRPLVGHVQ